MTRLVLSLLFLAIGGHHSPVAMAQSLGTFTPTVRMGHAA